MASPLESRHIAELHELAAELGIERYRMLSRDELARAIGQRDPDAAEALASAAGDGGEVAGTLPVAEPQRQEQRDTDERGAGDRGAPGAEREAGAEEDAGEPVSGVLDITPRGHGFIRISGLEASEGDVYVSPSQIRRCEMQRGDEVAGPARSPRRGERYPALIHVDSINGADPAASQPRLGDATPARPTRRIELSAERAGSDEEAVTLRAVDVLAPLAHGQRVLVRAAAGAGRTTLLRALARALADRDDLDLVVLLIDERPEEVADWRAAAPEADLAIATADMRSAEQLRLVELAIGRATRRAEAGRDVVLLIDSLSRIAVAADDPGRVKPIFGAGRETADEGMGALTVVATTIDDAGDGASVTRALETTESSRIVLDPGLVGRGAFPPIDVAATRIAGEEQLRSSEELAAVRSLRSDLAGLPPAEAIAELRRRIESSPDNRALLGLLAA